MTSRGSRIAPLTGVLAVALFVLAFIISGETPDTEDTAEEIVSFYVDDDSAQIAGSVLVAYGAVALLFFLGALRNRLRSEERAGSGLSAVAFGGGLLIAIGAALFAGINFTLADSADTIDPAAAQALNALNVDLFMPLAVGVVVFFLATGIAMVRGVGLPAWLGWVAIVIAIVGLTPVGFFAFLVGLAWIIVVSVLLAARPVDGQSGPSATAATDRPAEFR